MSVPSRNLSRRRFLHGAMGAGGAAILAGCTGAVAPQVVTETVVVKETVVVENVVEVTPTTPANVKITAHFTYSPTYKPRIEGWTAAFQEHYPYIDVDLIFEPWGEWQTKQLTLAAAGQTTELMAVHIARAQVLAQQGAILALDDWIAADPDFDIDDYYPASLVMFTYDNKLHGFPWDWGTGILGYNKDMFDAAGIDYPTDEWTFDDMLTAALALTDAEKGQFGYNGLPSVWNGPTHIGPWGADWVNEEETECTCDTPEAIEALQWWADLRLKHKVHTMPADDEILAALGMTTMLSTGKIGMVLTYPWDAGQVKVEATFNWDVAPWPKGPVTRISGGAGSGYAIGRDTQHKEEAWLYLRWFASKEGQKFLWGDTGASIPARLSAIDTFLNAEGMPEHARLWVDANNEYSRILRPISAPANEFITIATRELDLVFLGNKSVEDAVTTICADTNPILAANKA